MTPLNPPASTSDPAPARPWWQPGPFAYSAVEMLLVRLGYAWLVFDNIKWETKRLTTQAHPNGIANFFDLTWIARHPPGPGLKGLTIAGLALYVLGFLPALGLLPAMFFAMCIGTLIITQGEMQHSWQMVTMMGLAQLAVYAWHGRAAIRPSLQLQRVAVYAGTLIIAAGYLVCGLVKVIASNGLWIWECPMLAVQVMKTNWANYYDTLVATSPTLTEFAQFLVDHPWFTRAFFGAGLLLELFAFVILINRRWAFWFGLGLISLHVGISHVMNLHFIQHIFAVTFFLIIPNAIAAFSRDKSASPATLPATNG